MDDNFSLDSKLIELVQQFSHIWDKKHPRHKDTLAVGNSWQTISQIVGLPVDDCIGRWNNIRQRFAKERRKEKSVPSGSAPYFVLWPLYGLCNFLNDIVIPRRTKTNLNIKRKGNEKENQETSGEQQTPKKPKGISEAPTPELWDTIPNILLESIQYGTNNIDNNNSHISETTTTSDMESSCQAGLSRGIEKSEKRKIKEIKKKSVGHDVAGLVQTCTMMGQNINCFLEQASSKNSEKPAEFSEGLWHFLLSLGHLLKDIPDKKKKIMLQSKILEFVAEEWH